ncbi:MAG: rRNA pseudouridine synthase [Clostridiales bacterium]|nr:rRNA pseudouridine synthase [Clostridiales bacterium]
MKKTESETVRLDRRLAGAGLGTRKEVKKLVREGRVTVAGQIAGDPGERVPKSADISFDGEALSPPGYTYLIMNKPAGYVTSAEPDGGAPVTDLLPEKYARLGLSPVGRLDKDTVGLLVLTDDGAYNHRATSPRRGHEKIYYAVVEAIPRDGIAGYDETLAAGFRAGVTLDGGEVCRPAYVGALDDYIAETGKAGLAEICRVGNPGVSGDEVIVTVTEGKYHQVKRMFAAFGRRVTYLKRIGFAGLELSAGLPEGAVMETGVPNGEQRT